MPPAIRIESLTKFYGKARGVVELDLEVDTGEVLGFLGPNGAGKTTTIRLLLDLLRPTSGRAEILGMDVRLDAVRLHRRIGFLPSGMRLYDRMTATDLLDFFGRLRGLSDRSYRDQLVERLELDPSLRIGSYSSGNYRKLGIVQAFMHRPDVLILDEPTSGLDPLVQHEFYRLIEETRAEGRTVFLSSHILPEVEQIADRVAMIRDGRLTVVEEVGVLKQRAVRRVEIHFGTSVPAGAFEGVDGVRRVYRDGGGKVAIIEVEGAMDKVVKEAARFEVVRLTSHEADLEEIFLSMYRAGRAP